MTQQQHNTIAQNFQIHFQAFTKLYNSVGLMLGSCSNVIKFTASLSWWDDKTAEAEIVSCTLPTLYQQNKNIVTQQKYFRHSHWHCSWCGLGSPSACSMTLVAAPAWWSCWGLSISRTFWCFIVSLSCYRASVYLVYFLFNESIYSPLLLPVLFLSVVQNVQQILAKKK